LLDYPQYEAVSYVWGGEGADCRIKVNGALFAARPNLHQLLQHLRRKDIPRILWVDGICINQNDTTEPNHQVIQMRDVYSAACNVVAWLGLESGTSKLAFEALKVWGNNDEHHWDSSHGSCFDNKFLAPEYVSAIAQFMDRPWWHRVWTLQESILPRHLSFLCDTNLLSSTVIFRASKSYFKHLRTCCNSLYMSSPAGLTERFLTLQVLDRYRQNYKATNLLDLIIEYRNRQCLDPRDKVYGILGLATDDQIRLLEINYDRPLGEVYATAAFCFLRDMANLDLFSLVLRRDDKRGPQDRGKLPSWAPDWSEGGMFYPVSHSSTRGVLVHKNHGV
jgi:hypothetical protein